MVGPGRLELPTSRLSGVRSNHLSYGPLPAAVVQTVRHPKRKRNEGGGCRMCMHDRDLTDPVFVLMKRVRKCCRNDVQMPKKLFDFLDKRSGPLINLFP